MRKILKWYCINTIGILGEDNGWLSPTIGIRELTIKRSEIHRSYPWSFEDKTSMKTRSLGRQEAWRSEVWRQEASKRSEVWKQAARDLKTRSH